MVSCVVCVVLTMVMHGVIQSYGTIGTLASVFCGSDAFCGAVMRFDKGQPLPSPRIGSGRSRRNRRPQDTIGEHEQVMMKEP